jgi:hypothetical protein
VCTVFEYVNTKGVQLTTFELLTAIYAANREYHAEHGEDFHLPAEWAALKERLAKHSAVREIDDTDFLRAVCPVSTHFQRRDRPGTDAFTQPAPSCKRSDILDLELSEYRRWAPEIELAFEWSARFLDREGIYKAYDLPYRLQRSSLATIRTMLGAETDHPLPSEGGREFFTDEENQGQRLRKRRLDGRPRRTGGAVHELRVSAVSWYLSSCVAR